MVDNSTNPCEGMSGWFFSSFSLSGRPLHPVARHSICSQLRLRRLYHCAELLLASRALNRLSMGPAAKDNRGPLPPSIVSSFCPLPWLESAGGSVVPEVGHLALGAVRMPLEALCGNARNDSKRATIPHEPRVEETAGKWPRCGVPAPRRHGAPPDSPVR